MMVVGMDTATMMDPCASQIRLPRAHELELPHCQSPPSAATRFRRENYLSTCSSVSFFTLGVTRFALLALLI